VEAFNELELPLKVAGVGEEIDKQKPRSKKNIEYLGRVSDEERARLFAGAKAFIFPPEEDFGMVPVEAMTMGCPVIAYGKGGALEFVDNDVTGVLFSEQTHQSLVAAIKHLETLKLSTSAIQQKAKQFDVSVFRDKMRRFVEDQWKLFEAERHLTH
jgi:glycosyltransferase involved in cell wall biosynthesis